MRLVRLQVNGACGAPNAWWQVVDPVKTVQLTAETEPNSAAAWQALTWHSKTAQVSRAVAGPHVRKCRLAAGPDHAVHIDIYDLASLTVVGIDNPPDPLEVYASDAYVVLSASTVPDEAKVWKLLQWKLEVTAGPNQNAVLLAGGQPNERRVHVPIARNVKVAVSLGCDVPAKTLERSIHILRWPRLELKSLAFDTYPVTNDGVAQIGKEFDGAWTKGRADPATNCDTVAVQSILCYAKSARVSVDARFTVLEPPTAVEKVSVRGIAQCRGVALKWETQVTVSPGDATVATGALASDNPLPDEVWKYDPLTIEWSVGTPANAGWEKIGETKHLLYVTLGAPLGGAPAFWTLLDISCVGGQGKSTENDFVPAAFAPFASHVGDGKGFKRKGDGIELSYYNKGTDTDATPPTKPDSVYHTKGILSRADGTGRCGGWAHLLRHMLKLHGVTARISRLFVEPSMRPAPRPTT